MPHLPCLAHKVPVMQGLLYYNGILEFRKRSMLTLKQLRESKIFEILFVGKSSLLKKWQNSVIIWEILYFVNLETGKYGPKSGVFQIIWESWQHWSWDSSHEKTWNIPVQKQCVLVLKPMSEALLGTVLMLEQSQSNRLTKYLTSKKNCSCSAAVMFNYAGSTVPQSDGWWCSNPSE